MPNKPKLLKYKNYLSSLSNLPGANVWRNLYMIDETGQEIDAADDGDKSCALIVSWILLGFGWIDAPHSTVEGLLKVLPKYGWQSTTAPKPGNIVHWPANHNGVEHVGFYLGNNEFVSNNDEAKHPTTHDRWHYGNQPDAFYTRDFNA